MSVPDELVEQAARPESWPEWVTDHADLLRRAINQHSDQCPCEGDCYIILLHDELEADRWPAVDAEEIREIKRLKARVRELDEALSTAEHRLSGGEA